MKSLALMNNKQGTFKIREFPGPFAKVYNGSFRAWLVKMIVGMHVVSVAANNLFCHVFKCFCRPK